VKVSVLNDCDSDIRNFLRKETTYKEISVKPVFKEFIDLRRIFPVEISEKPTNIDYMLACLGLEFEGTKHSGIDDAINIARVALEIAKRDYVYTDRLKEHMFPFSNPHYYEHLVIISTQPKMKNNVELAMIAHDLRKGTTLWNNFGRKNVKK
jgi:Exonuclease